MNLSIILDIAVIAIVLIVALVNLFKGFLKYGFANLFFVGEVVAIVFLAPMLVNLILSIGFINGLMDTLNNAIKFGDNPWGTIIVTAVAYILVIIVIVLLFLLVFKLIKKPLLNMQKLNKSLKVLG